jgi:hypothetical protein
MKPARYLARLWPFSWFARRRRQKLIAFHLGFPSAREALTSLRAPPPGTKGGIEFRLRVIRGVGDVHFVEAMGHIVADLTFKWWARLWWRFRPKGRFAALYAAECVMRDNAPAGVTWKVRDVNGA